MDVMMNYSNINGGDYHHQYTMNNNSSGTTGSGSCSSIIIMGNCNSSSSCSSDDEMNNNNNNSSDAGGDLRRGPWTVDEDLTLINYISLHGEGRWNSLARCAGLKRTGKSCRLRWLNYLRPDVRRGNITLEEQLLILELHSRWGNRWSKIAQYLPGRTDNEIKNYWRTRVQKHAKQLKCDVNSQQFKDTMRYLWMPRLVERIQAASSSTTTTTTASSSSNSDHTNTTTCLKGSVAAGDRNFSIPKLIQPPSGVHNQQQHCYSSTYNNLIPNPNHNNLIMTSDHSSGIGGTSSDSISELTAGGGSGDYGGVVGGANNYGLVHEPQAAPTSSNYNINHNHNHNQANGYGNIGTTTTLGEYSLTSPCGYFNPPSSASASAGGITTMDDNHLFHQGHWFDDGTTTTAAAGEYTTSSDSQMWINDVVVDDHDASYFFQLQQQWNANHINYQPQQ